MTPDEQKKHDAEVAEYQHMQRSPLYFIFKVWNIRPQPVKAMYAPHYNLGLTLTGKNWDNFVKNIRPEWFGTFQEGKHITWQQTLVLFGIEKAIRGDIPMRVSIVSGHGIGKTALLSWLILWFLYTHPYAKVASTSPSKEQMYDVLWSELKKWIDKMPDGVKASFSWETSHIRMVESPQEWFARAKTSSKENTEALAGVHGPAVMAAVDEASGVEEPIFETMEGSLTDKFILVFLISNGTQNAGYFYDTHHKDNGRWQCYAFDALQSPRVTQESVDGWKDKYGEDSVQYAIRVKGKFPDEGVMDDKGYVKLFSDKDIRFMPHNNDHRFVGRVIGALDPGGEGQDLSAMAARDRLTLMIPYTEKTSNSKSLAAKSVTLCDHLYIDPIDYVIDAFGVGQDISMEIALITSQEKRPWRVTPVNTGEQCDDESDRELYVNKRAEGFYKMMLWTRSGGQFMELPTPEMTKKFKEELMSIRFKRTLNGRIQIMDKVTMKKLGFQSPNMADAASMTFLRPDGAKRSIWGDPVSVTGENPNPQFDPNQPLGDL